MSGTYVDMMGDIRWSEADHVARVEAVLRSTVTHTREHVMIRRMLALTFYVFGQILPDGAPDKGLFQQFGQVPTPAALGELAQQAQAYVAMDALAAQARIDSALLDTALDYEDDQAALAALPPAPTDGTADPDADQRAQLQAAIDSAPADTLALVADRAAYRASLNPAPADETA